MHNLKEIRKDFEAFKKSLEKRSIDIDHKEDFSLNRQYINFKKNLSENISLKVTLDVGRDENHEFSNDKLHKKSVDGKLEVFLKKSQLDWSFDGGEKFSAGLIGINAHGVQENNWGYRYIEKSSIDLWGFTKTADLGIGFSKIFFNKLSLSLQVSNGEGYKKPQENRYSRTWINITYGEKNLSKNSGYNLGVVYSYEPDTLKLDNSNIKLIGLFAGFSNKVIRIGLDYSMYKNMHKFSLDCINPDGCSEEELTTWAYRHQQSISFSSTYIVTNKLSAFARIDMYDPNLDFEYIGWVGSHMMKDKGNVKIIVGN